MYTNPQVHKTTSGYTHISTNPHVVLSTNGLTYKEILLNNGGYKIKKRLKTIFEDYSSTAFEVSIKSILNPPAVCQGRA